MKPFENFDAKFNNHEKQIEQIIEFAKSKILKIMWIIGPTGVGKTHLMKEMQTGYGYSEDQNYMSVKDCELVRADTLYYVFQKWFYPSIEFGKGNEYSMKRLKKCKCVVIDDLGNEKAEKIEAFKEGFLELLDEMEGKLAFTSNQTSKMINERYGNKIYSRLQYHMVRISLKGRDFRVYGGK